MLVLGFGDLQTGLAKPLPVCCWAWHALESAVMGGCNDTPLLINTISGIIAVAVAAAAAAAAAASLTVPAVTCRSAETPQDQVGNRELGGHAAHLGALQEHGCAARECLPLLQQGHHFPSRGRRRSDQPQCYAGAGAAGHAHFCCCSVHGLSNHDAAIQAMS